MIIPSEKLGPVLRAVRKHRGETQRQIALRFARLPGSDPTHDPIDRAKIAEVELGRGAVSKVRMRVGLADGFRVDRGVIDALAEGRLDVADAAAAFGVPVAVVAGALADPTVEAAS